MTQLQKDMDAEND